jgi:hypothetical protein
MKTTLNAFLSLCIVIICTVAFSKPIIKPVKKIIPEAPTWDPTFTSPQRSLIDNSHAVVMTIVSDGVGNLYIFDTTYSAISGDRSSLYVFDATSWDSTTFNIPSGHKYWWVPFDTIYQPVPMGTGGGTGGASCDCLGGYNVCKLQQPCFTAPCYQCFNGGGCTYCQLLGGWVPDPTIVFKGGIIIDAVSIYFKGHLYQ